jgi:hypothetical protein
MVMIARRVARMQRVVVMVTCGGEGDAGMGSRRAVGGQVLAA